MESTASPYHTNAVTFELPAQLKDKSMHMFTLSDNGPSDFSLVMSHADVEEGEQLDEFGNRLLKELDKALPKFQLRGMTQRTVDGADAVELAYSWRNEGVFMHQRQVITLMAGAQPGTTQALLIAATCPKGFTDELNATFDGVLDSVKLRRPLAGSPGIAPPALNCIFALSERRRTLHIYPDRNMACRKTDPREVEQDAWAFFDGDGGRLAPSFVVPNSGTLFRKPGSYVLSDDPVADAIPLVELLTHVAVLQREVAGVPFTSIEELRQHLQRRAGQVG